MPISCQQIAGRLLPLQITYSLGNAVELSAMNGNRLSASTSNNAAGALEYWCHKFYFQPLKLVFCDLKSRFPFNLKIKYPHLKLNDGPRVNTTFDPY
jgi:hypothetical protein